MTAGLVQVNLVHGDQVHRPRQTDHVAAFRSRAAAVAAARELETLGYRIEDLRRRWFTVWLEFSKQTAVDHDTAASFTREVVAVVGRHGGTYDGRAGFLVSDEVPAPEA